MAGIKNLIGEGCFAISTVAVTGKTFQCVIMQETSVITTLTSKSGVNLLTTYNMSGVTLYQGAYIPSLANDPIAAITLSSGSAIGYNNVG